MIISRTPFRISFFGGGTDFPGFFRQEGGAVLAATIDQYCDLSVHRLAPLFKHRFRASYSRTESVLRPEEFQHPLIREVLRLLDQREGIEIAHTADLPGQTGLGSSSAFAVGLLNAVQAFNGRRCTPEELARQAIEVERDRVGDAGGWQDQYEAAYGGFRRIDFPPDGQVRVRGLDLSAARARELEDHLLLFYLGSERSAETILREQEKRTGGNVPALRAMRQMVAQAETILAGAAPLAEFGDLLHESWRLKRSLSAGISTPAIDQAYETARAAGARGGKLLGAGGRGFLCLCAAPDRHAAIRAELRDLAELRFRFGTEGSRIIFSSDD